MKTKIILSVLVLLAIAFTLTPNPCLSAVPNLINYQGVLKDSTGVPIDGDVIMVFSIWDDSTNGSKLWEELQSIVHVNHGLFNVLLGGSTPIPSAVFNGVARYLQVQVNTSVLQPRRRIVSVGYAYKASGADTAEYARTDNDWVIDGSNIHRLQGNVGIGTTGPNYKLEVAGTAYVSGIATFGSIPVLPASDPTADNEATRRKFVTDKFNTSTGHDHDGSNSKKVISAIYDYGTSTSAYSTISLTNLKICYGTLTVNGGSSQVVTNLPFTSATSYIVVFAFEESGGGNGNNFEFKRNSGSQFTLDCTDYGVNGVYMWMAIGM